MEEDAVATADPDDGTGSVDRAAAETSARLVRLIEEEIRASGGWIRFARFMELALYAPGLGYYSAGAIKIGRDPGGGSDFVTAPTLTPLFGRALARPVAEVIAGGGDIVELGGGTGRLAADLLLELEALGTLPTRYLLLDLSADLRDRQRETLGAHAPHLLERVAWLDAMPDTIDGIVIGNEVLDALPVDLVVRDGAAWRVRGVVNAAEGFAFADRPLDDDLVEATASLVPDLAALPDGYQTETHLAASHLVASLAASLTERSVALFLDYGFPRSEYYHPQRVRGTLMTHRAHRASTDPLRAVGLCDITAHVDFSTIAAAAAAAGAGTIGYTSQSAFLIDCGIAGLLQDAPSHVASWAKQATALNLLLSEAEMGELFKAIAFARRPRTLAGFRYRDRTTALGTGM